MKLTVRHATKSLKFFTFLLLVLWHVTVAENAEYTDNDTFVPTQEWQEVADGQSVPAGVHIRINLTTGKKEAKLLDDRESNDKPVNGEGLIMLSESDREPPGEDAEQARLAISKTLEDALKNLPKENMAIEYAPEKLEEIKRKYKAYSNIKKTYEDLRRDFRSDAELVSDLIDQYRNLTKPDYEPQISQESKTLAEMRILDSLSYLVHQIDNAMLFIDKGGLEQILLPTVVNQTHIGLRAQAMRVLGALTQNNPSAQIKVFQNNFGSHLSGILISSTNTEELSSALYALGSLIRKFPHAQQRILSTYGTQALMAVLSKDCELKIKTKAVTLISDVIIEKQMAEMPTNDNPVAAAQYAELDFPQWLQTHSFCETMQNLVAGKLYDLLNQPDFLEHFVQALISTQPFCTPLWSQSAELRHTLLTLKNRYVQSNDEFRVEIALHMQKLLGLIYNTSQMHDEL